MASGFFALLDDIAVLMDDVATMGKVATKKTAGILGDDLAVNAEKASGFVSSREIPVLWAISKGSFINKLIILPIAFGLSAFLPSLIPLILIAGALYLAYEGAEKVYEMFVPHEHQSITTEELQLTKEEILSQEKEKVKSAIITDFILSVEIVIIALGSVIGQPLITQIMVVSFVAIVATIGVYGIVALIVRMDDFGLKLKSMSDKKFIQSNAIEFYFGGTEVNVGISIANCGGKVKHISSISNDFIGDTAISYLNKFDVDTSSIVRSGRPLGVYFLEVGAVMRPSSISYNRSHSSFSERM